MNVVERTDKVQRQYYYYYVKDKDTLIMNKRI